MLQSFPLLAFSLLVYAGLTFLTSATVPWYDRESFSLPLVSGDLWRIDAGDLFLSFSMVLLFVELLRSTRAGGASILNNALSVLVFVAALIMFLMVRGYGNSTFFLFMGMTLLDFMAGFVITTVATRRNLTLSQATD